MVRQQLAQRGICDRAVLRAMESVPRHLFLPPSLQTKAYADQALPLTEGQTISQPFVVALMAQALALRGNERVLEIGTGSGYAAAVLSLLTAEVYSIERLATLANQAAQRLRMLGYHNVRVIHGDGSRGLAEYAPYDVISVPAAAPWVPRMLREQLADGGRLVIPVGGQEEQVLLCLTRRGDTVTTRKLGGVRFVPLINEQGWEP